MIADAAEKGIDWPCRQRACKRHGGMPSGKAQHSPGRVIAQPPWPPRLQTCPPGCCCAGGAARRQSGSCSRLQAGGCGQRCNGGIQLWWGASALASRSTRGACTEPILDLPESGARLQARPRKHRVQRTSGPAGMRFKTAMCPAPASARDAGRARALTGAVAGDGRKDGHRDDVTIGLEALIRCILLLQGPGGWGRHGGGCSPQPCRHASAAMLLAGRGRPCSASPAPPWCNRRRLHRTAPFATGSKQLGHR